MIPAVAIFIAEWHCPFGDSILQVSGFMAITSFGSAIIVGNLTALISIGIAKYRRTLSDPQEKGKDRSLKWNSIFCTRFYSSVRAFAPVS